MAETFYSCPRCNDVLDRLQVSYVEVDKCPTCSGLWLDAGELVKLNLVGDPFSLADLEKGETSGGTIPPPMGGQQLACPACDGRLTVFAVDDSEIDQCYSCRGLWLDQGELTPALKTLLTSKDPALVDKLIGV